MLQHMRTRNVFIMRLSDEIAVFSGRYEEHIHITGSVKLRTYDGPYLTCLDGHRQTSLAYVIAVSENLPDVEIVGFPFQPRWTARGTSLWKISC